MNSKLISCIALVTLFGCDAPTKPPEQIAAEKKSVDDYKASKLIEDAQFEPIKQEVTTYLLSKNEPSIKDVHWLNNQTLRIGRFSKGEDQSGFAEYVCMVLPEHGWNNQQVKVEIIDMAKVLKNKYFEVVGEATCKYDNEPPTLVDFTKS